MFNKFSLLVLTFALTATAHASPLAAGEIAKDSLTGMLGTPYNPAQHSFGGSECYQGTETSKLITVDEKPFTRKFVRKGKTKVTVTFYASSKVRKIVTLENPKLNPDLIPSYCRGPIAVGYEMAGALTISVGFSIPGNDPKPEDLNALATALSGVNELKDLQTFRAPIPVMVTSSGIGGSLSLQETGDLLKPAGEVGWNVDASHGLPQLIELSYQLANTLDVKYPASRVQNLVWTAPSDAADFGYINKWELSQ